MVTVVSTFAGCGGSSLGYRLAGYNELLAVEWDDKAAETFRLNFSDVPLYYGDIAELSGQACMELAKIKIGELDVLDGSPPCQGFSTAGKRRFNDPRNSLFKEYVRLIRELQPRVIVMENVTGMIKGVMKRAFIQIMAELRGCGYVVSAEVMNAMHFNVPQSRRRVIIIGVREDLGMLPSHPKPQTKPISVRAALTGLARSGDEKRATPLQMKRWAETKRGKAHKERFSLLRLDWNKPAPTILKVSGSGGHFHPDESRLLDVSELKRLSSFPDSFRFPNWAEAVNRIGNSVPPNLMEAIARHIKEQFLTGQQATLEGSGDTFSPLLANAS
jgi:DNA (cytosine-5)-methyltransferase 1